MDRLVAPMMPEPAIGPIQTALDEPAAAPSNGGSDAISSTFICRNRTATGRVISPEGIQMLGFECGLGGDYPAAQSTRLGRHFNDRSVVTMRVQLADPADAERMPPGRLVKLNGNIRVTKFSNGRYFLSATDAKVVWIDPFDRYAPAHQGEGTGNRAIATSPAR
jgi:hypothetical protein